MADRSNPHSAFGFRRRPDQTVAELNRSRLQANRDKQATWVYNADQTKVIVTGIQPNSTPNNELWGVASYNVKGDALELDTWIWQG